MAIHVTTRLVNAADSTFPKSHIRRLYQVFFISEDLEFCDIYTCIVLAGEGADGIPKNIDKAFDFRIQFGLKEVQKQVLSSTKTIVNCLPDFRLNSGPWQFMWGALSKPTGLEEKHIRSALAAHVAKAGDATKLGFERLRQNGTVSDDTPIDYATAAGSELIRDLKTKSAILLRGSWGDDSDINFSICLPSNTSTVLTDLQPHDSIVTSAVCEYALRGTDEWIAGCDLIDWSHVRIPVNRGRGDGQGGLDHVEVSDAGTPTRRRRGKGDVDLRLSWTFAPPIDDEPARVTRFPCDEIRVYVVPPPHKRLDKDHSALTYSASPEPNRGDTVDKNALDEMISDKSVYFDEWERMFHIGARTVYRIRGAKFEEPTNNYWRFAFSSCVVRPNQLDPKLLASIILPIIAAFGIDSPRLKDIATAASASSDVGVWLSGAFPYWGWFEPVQAWVIFLVAMAGQFFLDFSWWNERKLHRPWLFSGLRWLVYAFAVLWFFGVFVFGVKETADFISATLLHNIVSWKVIAGLLRWGWTIAVATTAVEIFLAFFFFPDSYHFLGAFQRFRRNWSTYGSAR